MRSVVRVELRDSTLIPERSSFDPRESASVMFAVSRLNAAVKQGRVECCSLTGRRRECMLPELISCTPSGVRYSRSTSILESVEFTTSHYVGQACVRLPDADEDVVIRVSPRFGKVVWMHLLAEATRVYLPESFLSSGVGADSSDNEWLWLLMWRSAFERAMRYASVPKAYIEQDRNLRCFRGRLDVARQIRDNLTNQSRFRCSYKPLTYDNTINRTIRCVYHILSNLRLSGSAYVSIAEHDAKLASLGVGNSVTIREIDAINYTRMTEPYRQVMALSKVLLRGYGANEVESGGTAPAYFVDVAEIWENYLFSVMRRGLPEYMFVSPNEEGGDWLFENARSIRPDFMVYDKGGNLVAIMDAKYKRYDKIGRYSSDAHAVGRDDLYQMATYLYRFSSTERPISGIFLSPYSGCDEGVRHMAANGLHTMAVCNLDLFSLDEVVITEKLELREAVRRLKSAEELFCERLRKLLCGEKSQFSNTGGLSS